MIGDALFQAVVDDIDSDVPRLIYADHLTEQGDPRGEFITLQCTPEKTRRQQLREKALLKRHGEHWFGGFKKWAERPYWYAGDDWMEVKRGFLWGAFVRLGTAAKLKELFTHAPLLQRLRFEDERIEPAPQFEQLRSLHATYASADRLITLINDGHARGLTELILGREDRARGTFDRPSANLLQHHALQRLQLAHITVKAFAPALKTLHLTATPDTTLDVLSLPRAPLKELFVETRRFGAAFAMALAIDAPALETLTLKIPTFEPGAFEALVDVAWPKLKSLELRYVGLGTNGVQLSKLRAPLLERLDVQSASLSDGSVSALFASPLMNSLKVLNLQSNRFTEGGLAPLFARTEVALESLDLRGTKLPDLAIDKVRAQFPSVEVKA
ncbi:MAG: TIGR02996 domain-containing protein [Archangium sp.]